MVFLMKILQNVTLKKLFYFELFLKNISKLHPICFWGNVTPHLFIGYYFNGLPQYIVNYGQIKWDFCHYGYITKLKKRLVIMIHVCFGTFLTTCNFQCLGLKGNKRKITISFKAMLILFPLMYYFP
jgi:hypothetical protein